MLKRTWLMVIGLLLLVTACDTSHRYAGVANDPPQLAGDFALTDQTGGVFKLSDYTGKWVLLAYGYTHCPDVCPMTLSILRDVKKSIGTHNDQLGVVFVTIDPERDTADVMGKYVAHFDTTFKGLTGTAAEIAAATKPYNVRYEKKDSTAAVGYVMNHTAFIYLIDPQFNLRVTYPFGVKSDEITADLQYLMQQPMSQK